MSAVHKYFTIDELCRSDTARRLHINNTPPPEVITRLDALIENLLDPIREAWGKPIKVNSGYRCPKLNKAVGGVGNSQHLYGEAADITTGTKDGNKALYEFIRKNYVFDQLIDEKNYSWVHVSFRMVNRNQAFKL